MVHRNKIGCRNGAAAFVDVLVDAGLGTRAGSGCWHGSRDRSGCKSGRIGGMGAVVFVGVGT